MSPFLSLLCFVLLSDFATLSIHHSFLSVSVLFAQILQLPPMSSFFFFFHLLSNFNVLKVLTLLRGLLLEGALWRRINQIKNKVRRGEGEVEGRDSFSVCVCVCVWFHLYRLSFTDAQTGGFFFPSPARIFFFFFFWGGGLSNHFLARMFSLSADQFAYQFQFSGQDLSTVAQRSVAECSLTSYVWARFPDRFPHYAWTAHSDFVGMWNSMRPWLFLCSLSVERYYFPSFATSFGQGVCVFRFNVPSALLAEWPWSFTCHCGKMGWNGYRVRVSTILAPLLPGLELATFRSRVRRSNQQAIPAP